MLTSVYATECLSCGWLEYKPATTCIVVHLRITGCAARSLVHKLTPSFRLLFDGKMARLRLWKSKIDSNIITAEYCYRKRGRYGVTSPIVL